MQNVFQVDFALTGAATGGGKTQIKGMGHPDRPVADAKTGTMTTSRADASPPNTADTDRTGDEAPSGFQSVFDGQSKASRTAPSNGSNMQPEPGIDSAEADTLAVLEAVSLSLQSDDIDLDDLLGGNAALIQQAQKVLTALTNRLGAVYFSTGNVTTGDLTGQDLMAMVKDAMANRGGTLSGMTSQLTAQTAMPGQTPLTSGGVLTGDESEPALGRNEKGQTLAPLPAAPQGIQATGRPLMPRGDGAQAQNPLQTSLPNQGAGSGQTTSFAQDLDMAQTPSSTTINASPANSAGVTTGITPGSTPPLIMQNAQQSRGANATALQDASALDGDIEMPSDMTTPRTGAQMNALQAIGTSAQPPVIGPMQTLPTDPVFFSQAGFDASMSDGGNLGDGSDTSVREARSGQPFGTPGLPAPSQMTPAQAAQVTRQIAMAIQNNPGRSVEITLNPAELGHVRISLSSAEAGMIVSIQADRPETLDLMRRNADLLAEDFRNIGYDTTSFSFEGSGGQDANRASSDEDGSTTAENAASGGSPHAMAPDDPDMTPPPTVLRTGDGAIDIRL